MIGAGAPVYGLSSGESLFVNVLFFGAALVSLLYCIRISVREKKMYPLYLFLGGTLAVYYEILTDSLGRCVWATEGEWVISALGRDIPLFAVATYMFYFPIAMVSINLALEKGMTFSAWMKAAFIAIPIAYVFELYPVNAKWWWYYGDGQPLAFMGLPAYWSFAAMNAVMGSAAIAFLMRKYVFKGKNEFLLVFVVPLSVVGLHMPAIYPVHMALSTTTNIIYTTIGAIVSILISTCLLVAVGKIATARSGNAMPVN
jgi:hypothetical protein